MKDYSLTRGGVCVHYMRTPAYEFSEELSRDSGATWMFNQSLNGDRKAPNAQTIDKFVEDKLTGFVVTENEDSTFFESYTGSLGYTADPGLDLAGYSSEVYNKALEKFYTKLRGELDLSIDLLQARQVRTMMGDALKGLNNMATTVRKMRRAPFRTASDLWLQWTYGWKPLASSLYDATLLFANGARKGFITIKVVANEQENGRHEWFPTGDVNIPGLTTYDVSRRCIIVGNYGVDESVLNNLASMTSLNPVSIAWELVPYSFVFDWFYDVGGYLRNLESACLYSSAFKTGFMTQGFKVKGDTNVDGSHEDFGLSRTVSCKGRYVRTGKNRSVLFFSPSPKPPRFVVDLGTNRMLSAAALLQQQLGRR